MANKINPQDLNYINVPLSIIDQRWYKSEAAVRAWVFFAWQALLPRWDNHKTKIIKGKLFNLSEGELICTRNYLAKSLGLTDSTAKSNTDKLRRTKTISVKQEVLSKDPQARKNRLSRVTVNGVPVPSEPYIKMYFGVQPEVLWQTPGLAQLYIYMMCKAEHKPCYTVGTRHKAILLQPGDVVIKRSEVLAKLKCKEWQYKANLQILEDSGIISKVDKLGNNGLLLHLTYYPVHKDAQDAAQKPKQEDVKPSAPVVAAAPAGNVSVSAAPVATQTTPAEPVIHAQAAPQTTSQDISKIFQTPVTDAIKYLYIDLKHNKDIDRLNQIIQYVNSTLPDGYPIDRLRDAMDYYYKDHGSKYIDEHILEQYIAKYYTKIKRNQAASRQAQEPSNPVLPESHLIPGEGADKWAALLSEYGGPNADLLQMAKFLGMEDGLFSIWYSNYTDFDKACTALSSDNNFVALLRKYSSAPTQGKKIMISRPK